MQFEKLGDPRFRSILAVVVRNVLNRAKRLNRWNVLELASTLVRDVPDVSGQDSGWRVASSSLETAFRHQKAASKPLNDAIYCMFVCLINSVLRSDPAPLARQLVNKDLNSW